jgi:hypothetical protein
LIPQTIIDGLIMPCVTALVDRGAYMASILGGH